MDTTNSPRFTFMVPLTLATHQIAQDFYRHHSNVEKAKQVYLNTLSVAAVQFYLHCLGIETDLAQSQSWNPILQTLSNTADLWVIPYGRLECCPVLPGMETYPVPFDAWSDGKTANRIGYVFVQLNADLTEAALLGFVPQVAAETVRPEELHNLEDLPQFLQQQQSQTITDKRVVLTQWLTSMLEAGWDAVDHLQQYLTGPELSYQFRHSLLDRTNVDGMKRGKVLSLSDAPEGRLVLLVGVAPTPSDEFQITVELYPVGGQPHLPRSLHLMILDDRDQAVLQADGSHSHGLEFRFLGSIGERFTTQIQWQDIQIQERFEI